MKGTFRILGLFLAVSIAGIPVLAAPARGADDRAGTVTFDIDIQAPAASRVVNLRFPYPTSDSHRSIGDLRFGGNHTRYSLAREPRSGALYLYAEWTGRQEKRTLTVSFRYPYCEADGRPLDYCRPRSFRYAIRFRED